MKKILSKIFILNFLFLAVAVGILYLFVNFLYERLYVQHTQENMIEAGDKLQKLYDGGKVDDKFLQEVESHARFLNYELFAVRDPKELSTCLPFDVDYQSLIGAEERKKLINGEVVVKIGYEERFDRQIISVIHPLVDEKRLEGIIYQYYPLSHILDLAKDGIVKSAAASVVFLLNSSFLMFFAIKKLLHPLANLERATKLMKNGDYSVRVPVESNDEVGELTLAFNEMASSIEEEDDRQKQFLANVSHELRTPLSYILGYSEELENSTLTEDERKKYMKIIHNESKRLHKLTVDLLTLTKEQTIKEDPIVMAELLREVVSLAQLSIKEKSIQVELELDEEIIVKGDNQILEQVFINLLENAIRYSEEDKRIAIKLVEHEGRARISVKDEGKGIPKEDLPRITDRFYRVNKARTTSDGGAGLGLNIVKHFVNMHAGQLQIESELDKGTEVIVDLPLYE